VEPALDGFPLCPLEDGRMLTGIAAALVGDLADVDRIAQDRVELPARERCPAIALAGREGADRAGDAGIDQLVGDEADVAELAVAGMDVAHDGRMLLDHG